MTRLYVQRSLALIGLSVLSLTAACGREGAAVAQREIGIAKSNARMACADPARGWRAEKRTNREIVCEKGIDVGAMLAKRLFSGSSKLVGQGEERKLEITVHPLKTYQNATYRKHGFMGFAEECRFALSPVDGEGFAAVPASAEEKELCEQGAAAFFIALGQGCGIDLPSVKPGETATCVIDAPEEKPSDKRHFPRIQHRR